jgi:hypothetical protein
MRATGAGVCMCCHLIDESNASMRATSSASSIFLIASRMTQVMRAEVTLDMPDDARAPSDTRPVTLQ